MTKSNSSLFYNKSIIYVNYSPYENAGKIFDYLLESFDSVFLFSLGFHYLRKKKKHNQLLVYRKGILQSRYPLFQLPVPELLLFITLPIRSIMTLIQIISFSCFLKYKYGNIDIFFSVNAFTSWIGIVLQKLKIVSKTIFWVWDYYPPIHESKVITLARKIYWYFDKWATTASDKVLFVNNRLISLRKQSGIVSKKSDDSVIPLGTEIFNISLIEKRSVVFGFIGVIKKSMGLGGVFSHAEQIIKYFPKAKFHIIGSGPDEEYFKKEAKALPLSVTFHGYLEEEAFNNVLKKCSIGVALYQPDPGNVSNFGDAGKVKRYLSLGIPVIITDVFEFSKEVQKNKAGIIVRYGNSKDLIEATKKIMSNYKTYQKNAFNLGEKYFYKKLYPRMFKFDSSI